MEKAAQAVLDARAQFMGEGARASARFNVESKEDSITQTTPSKNLKVKRPEGRAPGSTLADLYDPIAMPPVLAKAHAELDRAVDRCYRKEPFASDRARVEFLFNSTNNSRPRCCKRPKSNAPDGPRALTPNRRPRQPIPASHRKKLMAIPPIIIPPRKTPLRSCRIE